MLKRLSNREKDGIFIVPTELNLDPVDGYLNNNGVHPNPIGYAQIGASFSRGENQACEAAVEPHYSPHSSSTRSLLTGRAVLQLGPQARSRGQLRLPVHDDRQRIDQFVVERADVRPDRLLKHDIGR